MLAVDEDVADDEVVKARAAAKDVVADVDDVVAVVVVAKAVVENVVDEDVVVMVDAEDPV